MQVLVRIQNMIKLILQLVRLINLGVEKDFSKYGEENKNYKKGLADLTMCF